MDMTDQKDFAVIDPMAPEDGVLLIVRRSKETPLGEVMIEYTRECISVGDAARRTAELWDELGASAAALGKEIERGKVTTKEE